ncbi:MAG: hypothetical protein V7K63_21535 [Nostoc sp.]
MSFSTKRSANANALNESSYISDVYDGLRLGLTLKTAVYNISDISDRT